VKREKSRLDDKIEKYFNRDNINRRMNKNIRMNKKYKNEQKNRNRNENKNRNQNNDQLTELASSTVANCVTKYGQVNESL